MILHNYQLYEYLYISVSSIYKSTQAFHSLVWHFFFALFFVLLFFYFSLFTHVPPTQQASTADCASTE